MKRLVRAELLKLRTTRTVYATAAGMAALVVLGVVAGLVTAGQQGRPPLETEAGVRNVLAAAGSGVTLVTVIGVLVMTGEYRHQTVTSTFLVTPRRGRVVAAKLVAGLIVGLAFAAVASTLTLAVGLPWMAAEGVPGSLVRGEVALALLGAVTATALYGALGVSVGATLPNQVAALVTTLSWTLVVEGLLVAFLPEVGRWLPGGANAALLRTTTPEGGLLPMWAGGLLLVAYSLAFAVAGARFAVRRDVT